MNKTEKINILNNLGAKRERGNINIKFNLTGEAVKEGVSKFICNYGILLEEPDFIKMEIFHVENPHYRIKLVKNYRYVLADLFVNEEYFFRLAKNLMLRRFKDELQSIKIDEAIARLDSGEDVWVYNNATSKLFHAKNSDKNTFGSIDDTVFFIKVNRQTLFKKCDIIIIESEKKERGNAK